METSFIKYIKNSQTFLEKEPLETVGRMGELMAYKNIKAWQCMDTKRDKDYLDKVLKKF